MKKETRNADYIREQQIRKPGIITVKIRVSQKYQIIWNKPHLNGVISIN